MPAVPPGLLEPIWVEFHAAVNEARGGAAPEFAPRHPWGCHRRRISDRVVFVHLLDALVHRSGVRAGRHGGVLGPHDPPPLTPWVKAGVAQRFHAIALHVYDLIIGLQLANLPVDGCITKAPYGGDKAGPSPVDRCKGGRNRSVATDGHGVRLGVVSAGANGHDSPLLAATLAAAAVQVGPLPKRPIAHLDAGDDRGGTRDLLAELGFDGEISGNGVPAPIQVGNRWVVERTHSPMNSYGKLRRRTDKDSDIVDFFLYLTAAIVTVRQLIQRARTRYR